MNWVESTQSQSTQHISHSKKHPKPEGSVPLIKRDFNTPEALEGNTDGLDTNREIFICNFENLSEQIYQIFYFILIILATYVFNFKNPY